MSTPNFYSNIKPLSLENSKTLQRVEELFRKSRSDYNRKQFEQSGIALTKAIDYLTQWQTKKKYDIYKTKKINKDVTLGPDMKREIDYLCQLALGLHDSRAAVQERTSLPSALDDGKSMINISPTNPRGYLRVGKILRLLKEHERALLVYKKGLSLCADNCNSEQTTERLRGLYNMLKELYNEVSEDCNIIKTNLAKHQIMKKTRVGDIEHQPKRQKVRLRGSPNNMLEKLPSELVEKIILMTDLRSMARFQYVCKSWHKYISENMRLWSKMGLNLLEFNQKINRERKVLSLPLRMRHLSHRILNDHLVKALGDPKRWGNYTQDGPLLEYISVGNLANAEDEERCVKALLKISRVRAIKLNLDYNGAVLINSLLAGAHNWQYHLQSLHLQGGRRIELLLNQFYKQMPMLREINLNILPGRASDGHAPGINTYVIDEIPEPDNGLKQLAKFTITSSATELSQHSFQVGILYPFILKQASNSLTELCLTSRVFQSYGTWALSRPREMGPVGYPVFDGTNFPLLERLTIVNINIQTWPFVRSQGVLNHLEIRETTMPDIVTDHGLRSREELMRKFSCFQKLESLVLASVDYESRSNGLICLFDAVLMYGDEQEMTNLTRLVLSKSATLLSVPQHLNIPLKSYIAQIACVTPHLVSLDISCIHGVDDAFIEMVGKSWPKLQELLVHDTRVTGVGLINFFKSNKSHRSKLVNNEKRSVELPLVVGIRNCDVNYDTVEWLRKNNVTILLT
ncbi:hypothetical protein NADFUDRAFT_76193 [Nadsonia fulvescens var. elongata DSM 6958]|uniref:F-box domain-containing protein n=1 Tax=Nadsonia fulvescens var. elongata DSM 6958 TaxID=857566 RepID=A0A1E3PSJ1_9ASCO|nr:hypothetical protein NADFUDRAFT_76193 [Nadsonia fulvescens var. elongata DSM 6958]